MRGASALQAILTDFSKSELAVFVVWEPVLLTDRFGPTSAVLARVHDARARQYWDRERLVSSSIGRAAGYGPDDIVWDFVGVYPAGVRWEAEVPEAAFASAPVVDAVDELRAQLSAR